MAVIRKGLWIAAFTVSGISLAVAGGVAGGVGGAAGAAAARGKRRVISRCRIDRASVPFPQRLIEGHRAFLGAGLRRKQDRYRELAESGQSPEIMVIGCCDSRVSPEVIFDARPGELFVVRNVANIVPPYAPDGHAHGVSAALEFGVGALKVKHIVVLGHARCGGVKAFAEDAEPLSPGDFIGNWMKLMSPAAEKLGPRGTLSRDEYLTRLEQANVVNSIDNLMTFPRLRTVIERR